MKFDYNNIENNYKTTCELKINVDDLLKYYIGNYKELNTDTKTLIGSPICIDDYVIGIVKDIEDSVAIIELWLELGFSIFNNSDMFSINILNDIK